MAKYVGAQPRVSGNRIDGGTIAHLHQQVLTITQQQLKLQLQMRNKLLVIYYLKQIVQEI